MAIHINTLNGGDITITTTPPIAPSPYFAYDEDRVITGLYQGEPNIQGEDGWTYGGADVVENYATAIEGGAFDDGAYLDGGIPPSKAITGNITFQNVTSIGSYAFVYCGLTSVTMPNVTSIGECAFRYCISLTSVTMPNVTSIEYGAFDGCRGLTSMTIPDSVTSIGDYALNGCSGLTSVTFEGKDRATVQGMTDYPFGLNRASSSGVTIHCTDGDIQIPYI